MMQRAVRKRPDAPRNGLVLFTLGPFQQGGCEVDWPSWPCGARGAECSLPDVDEPSPVADAAIHAQHVEVHATGAPRTPKDLCVLGGTKLPVQKD